MKFLFQLSAFLCFTVAAFGQLQGKVVGIADGDTFTMLTEDKRRIKVRVYGIDCPERGQDYGNVAKTFTSDLIYGKQVYVQEKDLDRYGRTLGVVYVLPDSTCLNTELLKAGLAWHYVYFDPNNPEWDKLEQHARRETKGLWQKPDVIAPWEYRKQKANTNNE